MDTSHFINEMEKLSSYYNNRPAIPPAIMVLSGEIPIPINLSIPDAITIGRNMHFALVDTIGHYKTTNSIVNEYLNRWLLFLGTLNRELHILFFGDFFIRYPHLFSDIDIKSHMEKYFTPI